MVMQTSVLRVSCSITQYLKHSRSSGIMDLTVHSHLLDASIFANVCVSALYILWFSWLSHLPALILCLAAVTAEFRL